MTEYAFAIHLGFAVALCEVARRVREWFVSKEGTGGRLPAIIFVVLPLAILTIPAVRAVVTTIPMGAKAPGSVRDMEAARDAVVLVNLECDEEQIAVVPERLIADIKCRAVPAAQVLVAEGIPNVHWYVYVEAEDLLGRETSA